MIADHVYTDKDTGKKIIAGVFTKIVRRRHVEIEGESKEKSEIRKAENTAGSAGSPWLYFALTSVHGEVDLELRWVHLQTETVLFRAVVKVKSASPLDIIEGVAALPRLNYGRVGLHALELLHDDIPIGSLRILLEEEEAKQ